MRPKKIVLCVDDNEAVLSQRCFLLETHGYRTLRAATPEVALGLVAAAEAYGPGSIALLLTDLVMPGMDGNELARMVKRMRPSLPVMIASGMVVNYDCATHADAFLPKGAASAAEMLERVKILCARKRGPKKATIEAIPQAVAACR